jgi:hypothetical protein
MIPDKYVALIHKAAFDEIGDEERGELEAYLGQNPEARALHADLLRMARAFEETPEVEPPANLKKRVVNLVAARRRELAREKGGSRSEGKASGIAAGGLPGKKAIRLRAGWLIGCGAAVAAIVLVVALTHRPPSRDVVRGAIGGGEGATKHPAAEIGGGDVILRNPEFEQLLQDSRVQDLLRSPEFQQLMRDPKFVEMLRDTTFIRVVSQPGTRQAFLDALPKPTH